MKILTLLYNQYEHIYGINDSYFNGFNKNSYIIKENELSSKTREFLKDKDLLKRKIILFLGLREEGNKLENLARKIQEINPKAVIMGEIKTIE